MKRIRSRRVDQSWSAPLSPGAPSDPGGPGGPDVSVVRGGQPSARRIAAALGRVESRKLALSPWFLAGILLCVTSLMIFPGIEADVQESSMNSAKILQDMPFTVHPFVAMALLAGNRNATRARRDRTAELFHACPTTPATRAAGALCSAWLPVVAFAAFVPAYLWQTDAQSEYDLGPLGPTAVPNVLTTLVLGAGGVALGIALGRWVRVPLAAVAAITLIAVVDTWLSAGDPEMIETPMLLSTMGSTGSGHPQPVLTTGQAWFHFAWLAVLTGATALVAIAPFGRHRATRVPPAVEPRP